jgi:NAD(P)-dependent dehydrogenase (short-subunit alcohol dehydrogenase family)
LLSKKVVFVTGGSRGIGKGIAIAMARAGAKVAISYNNNKGKAEELFQALEKQGLEITHMQMSAEDRASIQRALALIKSKYGAVDILVNNAAISQEKHFENISDEDWSTMLKVNLQGPFMCAQEILPDMVKNKWGRIINIASVGGQWGGYNQVHYAASKAGLINLTKSLARIYSRQGIMVNAIAPGLVYTDMTNREIRSQSGKEKISNIPMGRVATIEEVAGVAVFLASDAADYISGQTINVNGGMYFG